MSVTGSAPRPACPHLRIQVVARQQGEQFFECLDCRSILDGDDLPGTAEEREPNDEE